MICMGTRRRGHAVATPTASRGAPLTDGYFGLNPGGTHFFFGGSLMALPPSTTARDDRVADAIFEERCAHRAQCFDLARLTLPARQHRYLLWREESAWRRLQLLDPPPEIRDQG